MSMKQQVLYTPNILGLTYLECQLTTPLEEHRMKIISEVIIVTQQNGIG